MPLTQVVRLRGYGLKVGGGRTSLRSPNPIGSNRGDHSIGSRLTQGWHGGASNAFVGSLFAKGGEWLTTIDFSIVYNAECFQLMKTFEIRQPLMVHTTITGQATMSPKGGCSMGIERLLGAKKRLKASCTEISLDVDADDGQRVRRLTQQIPQLILSGE